MLVDLFTYLTLCRPANSTITTVSASRIFAGNHVSSRTESDSCLPGGYVIMNPTQSEHKGGMDIRT
jgi:hypothetical protein